MTNDNYENPNDGQNNQLYENKVFETANRWGNYASEIKKGDAAFFTPLYKESFDYAFHISKNYVHNDEDAMDVVQDGYTQILKHIGNLQDPTKCMGWMKRIFTNVSINFMKKKRPDLFLNYWESEEDVYLEKEGDEIMTPEFYYLDSEKRMLVQRFLSELPEKQRIVMQMVYIEELSIAETAQLLEIPEGTVKSRLFTARNRLKEVISQYEEKTGEKMYSFALIPLLLRSFDMSRIFEPVAEQIKSQVWVQLTHSLETIYPGINQSFLRGESIGTAPSNMGAAPSQQQLIARPAQLKSDQM